MSQEKTIFQRIIAGEVPHRKLYEDDLVFAFLDAFPNHPGHSLVIPKEPHRDIFELPDATAARMFQVARDLAKAIKEAAGAEGINIAMIMIIPPIVGVPSFAFCPSSPNSLTVSPICIFLRIFMILPPNIREIVKDKMIANAALNVIY